MAAGFTDNESLPVNETRALAKNVFYVPGDLCYADDPSRPKPNHEMRISFGGAKEANVGKGIARLGAVFRECLRA